MENSSAHVAGINGKAARYLYRSANWTIFFAVLTLMGAAIMFFAGLGLMLGGQFINNLSGAAHSLPFSIAWLGLVYFVVAAPYAWVGVLMLGFAKNAKEALKTNDDMLIEHAFRKMNRFLTVMGVLTIIAIFFYFIFVIAMVVGGITGMLGA